MAEYLIILQNGKTKFYNRLGLLLILGNTAFFLYLSIFAADKKIQYNSIVLVITLLVIFFLQRYFKGTIYRFGLHPYFLLLMAVWFSTKYYWMGIIMFLFDILHTVAVQKLTVQVGKKEIRYPSFPVKKIQWASLSNVILKDNFLTIDFNNNKIIQQLIDEEKTKVNEQEFNEFCRQQLKKANSEQ